MVVAVKRHLGFACVSLAVLVVVAPIEALAGAITAAAYSFSLGGGDPLVFDADGTLVGSGISVGEITLQPGSSFAGTISTPLDAPPASAFSVLVSSHMGGTWVGDPLSGTTARVVAQGTIYGFGGTPLIRIPFQAGSVGTTIINEGGVQVSVFAQGWTSGTLAIDDGSGGTLATAMGTVSSGTPGSATLVSGARVQSSLADPTFAIHTLHLEFERLAPEPGGLLTLSVCALVLAFRASRRSG